MRLRPRVPATARESMARGGNFKALHPHGHRNGPNFAVQDGQGGFGGDIPRGKPSAAGGDDEIDVTPIGRSGELGLDLGDLIRDNGGVGNGKTGFLQHGADGGAAGIHPLAAAAQIADGDNCCCICHNYVLLFFEWVFIILHRGGSCQE